MQPGFLTLAGLQASLGAAYIRIFCGGTAPQSGNHVIKGET